MQSRLTCKNAGMCRARMNAGLFTGMCRAGLILLGVDAANRKLCMHGCTDYYVSWVVLERCGRQNTGMSTGQNQRMSQDN